MKQSTGNYLVGSPGGVANMTLHERWFSVPDFESKLNLLQQRSARLYGVGEPRLLHLRKDIAAALGVNQTLLSRWSRQNRIPKMDVVVKLAKLFAIDHSWLAMPFEEFRELCEGRPAAYTWHELMQLAQDRGVGKIEELEEEEEDVPHLVRMMHARPSFIFSSIAVEKVHVGATIRVTFHLPLSDTSAPLWAGWHTILFSQDPTGYSCLLPRFANRHGFPSGRLRSEARLVLPPLMVDTPGLCSVILIASREPIPSDLKSLLTVDEEGDGLGPAIARTAAHMTPLALSHKAGVLRLRYQAM
jgi:transcriptional regulator with XRE-family HTH domain